MKLANPIYDAAFKYLLEDTEIAKALIGKIIKEEIIELMLKPREVQHQSDKYVVVILRVDFKAVIKTKTGEYRNVLIEIQKGKKNEDILRFRKYLASNYQKSDTVKNDKGKEESKVLPIITIYFLGFSLRKVPTPVARTKRTYEDLVTDLLLTEKEDFIEQLTHDTFVIQIPRLERNERAEIEGLLKVFNQDYKLSDDNRLVELSEEEVNKYQLLKKIAHRLKRAASDESVLAKMDLEDEVDNLIEKHIRENEELKEALEAKDKVLEEKDKILDQLKKEKMDSAKELMMTTNLDDAQIASIQKLNLAVVQKLRQDLKK